MDSKKIWAGWLNKATTEELKKFITSREGSLPNKEQLREFYFKLAKDLLQEEDEEEEDEEEYVEVEEPQRPEPPPPMAERAKPPVRRFGVKRPPVSSSKAPKRMKTQDKKTAKRSSSAKAHRTCNSNFKLHRSGSTRSSTNISKTRAATHNSKTLPSGSSIAQNSSYNSKARNSAGLPLVSPSVKKQHPKRRAEAGHHNSTNPLHKKLKTETKNEHSENVDSNALPSASKNVVVSGKFHASGVYIFKRQLLHDEVPLLDANLDPIYREVELLIPNSVQAGKWRRERAKDRLEAQTAGVKRDYVVGRNKEERKYEAGRNKEEKEQYVKTPYFTDRKKTNMQQCDRHPAKPKDLQGAKYSKGPKEKPEKTVNEDDVELQSRLSSAILQQKPKVKWSDVAGLKDAKTSLKEAVIYPIRYPQFFQGERKPWKGILLYGPPGTGKSFLAKACANEANSTFFSISSSDLMSKYVGEGERNVRNLFDLAKEKRPSIIFIDEIDALVSKRDSSGGSGSDVPRRILTEFLVQMDGVGRDLENVLTLGATNTPWTLDAAIRRRFEKLIYISLPDLGAREHLFKLHIGNTPNNIAPEDLKVLASRTEGFSGSDIKTIVKSALFEPLRTLQNATHFKKIHTSDDVTDFVYIPCSTEDVSAEKLNLHDLPDDKMRLLDVSKDDFIRVLDDARPSVTKDDVKKYKGWTQQFGQEG